MFLIQDTKGQKQSTKRYKYTLLKTLLISDNYNSRPATIKIPEKIIS